MHLAVLLGMLTFGNSLPVHEFSCDTSPLSTHYWEKVSALLHLSYLFTLVPWFLAICYHYMNEDGYVKETLLSPSCFLLAALPLQPLTSVQTLLLQ